MSAEVSLGSTPRELEDICELYDLLKDDLDLDVQLHLECNDDQVDSYITVGGNTSNRGGTSAVADSQASGGMNACQTVNIPRTQGSSYRLTFPEDRPVTHCTERFHCGYCTKSFSKRTVLLDHCSITHRLREQFPCCLCSYKGHLYKHWYKHMKRKHPDTNPDVRHLDPTAARDTAVRKTMEPDSRSDCHNAAGSALEGVQVSCNTDAGPASVPAGNSEPIMFTCSECSKSFVKRKALLNHKRTHSERTWLCKMLNCGAAFKTSSALNEHKICVHGPKTYRCSHPNCTKAYALERDLNYHKKAHEENFKCATCGKSFRDKHNLTTHQKLHSGQKDCKCPLCDYVCVQKASLNWHMISKHKACTTLSS